MEALLFESEFKERFPTRSFFTLGNDVVWFSLSKKRTKNLILRKKL